MLSYNWISELFVAQLSYICQKVAQLWAPNGRPTCPSSWRRSGEQQSPQKERTTNWTVWKRWNYSCTVLGCKRPGEECVLRLHFHMSTTTILCEWVLCKWVMRMIVAVLWATPLHMYLMEAVTVCALSSDNWVLSSSTSVHNPWSVAHCLLPVPLCLSVPHLCAHNWFNNFMHCPVTVQRASCT